MRKNYLLFAFVLCVCLLSSCAALKQQMALNMSDVRLGMSRTETVNILGRPNLIVSAYTADNGDVIEVAEYIRGEQNSLTNQTEARPIWLYFVNDELFEWGPGENWETDAAFRRAIMNRSRDYQLNRTKR